MFNSLWLPHWHDFAGDSHHSEQNVVNGILISACPIWPRLAGIGRILQELFTDCFP
jgi:hypothetical protein